MLSVIVLNVIVLSVVMLSVMAPPYCLSRNDAKVRTSLWPVVNFIKIFHRNYATSGVNSVKITRKHAARGVNCSEKVL
jgi:hypothetical protein